MNLNSYIGLMGGSYREVQTPGGPDLVPAERRRATWSCPNAEYVLTLDADSVILPEYCLRLVHLLEQRGAQPRRRRPVPVQRLPRRRDAARADRRRDHRPPAHHPPGDDLPPAPFWVGANAILRKRALEDIEEIEYKGEFQIRRYISDRTVIEDTESTIDLAARGWTLHNYPERLAYSATPPDFGSLCIQRHRWANGGLLIIPKLVRAVRRGGSAANAPASASCCCA